ncbi:hypothetical protein [Tenacibaculum sp. SG-28]|uniref:hypothetical protein n=1 Tax=Tenacibaculum sp. SG-28 TaxID=754426 RepID=UPI000CF3913B|nr:hypothetical protein [Tenacibaculum sp. SG-28]PQJ23056.1 hypothetical protein BSU00_02005 [Tenacibaculum sp. SG-28]
MINTKETSIKFFFESAANSIRIDSNREEILLQIADKIREEYTDRKKLNLNFICTHNSRRSQFAQIWAFYAISYFNLENIYSYSGGTEASAFHRNTINALENSGFNFNVETFSHQNPKYLVNFKGCKTPLKVYSKIFDNPENGFPYIAITTCDDADENCPFIPDAIHRFHLPFKDPKRADDKENTLEVYSETNQRISAEIFYIFKEVHRQLNL